MSDPHAQRPPLSAVLRAQRAEILSCWEDEARRVASAAHLPSPQLLDHIPPLLDRVAELMEREEQPTQGPAPDAMAHQHALARLEEGFDLSEVIQELSLLRDCILARHAAAGLPALEVAESRTLHRALDRAISASAVRYTHTRDRVLRVLDRISATALEAGDLEELLQQIATAFREEVPAVDTVVVLLREGERLVTRVTLGLDETPQAGISLRLGEGFAGTVAEEGRAIELASAASDPLVLSDGLKVAGVQALYGLPLVADGEVIGVAHMGSLTSSTFSRQDKVLFGSMAARATAGIRLHTLREEARRRADQLELSERRFRATFENAAVGIAHVGLDGAWQQVNERYAQLLGYSPEELERLTFQALTHPEDVAREQRELSRLVREEVRSYALEKRHVCKDGDVLWVRTSVSKVRQDGTSHLVVVTEDTTAETRLRERLTFLSRASQALASSLDLERIVEEVARLVVPFLADCCCLEVVRGGEGHSRDLAAIAWGDPPQVELRRDLPPRVPPSDAPPGVERVLVTGRPELLVEVDDVPRRVARDQRHVALLEREGVQACLIVPLRAGDGVVGALSLAQGPARRPLDQEEMDLALELGRRISLALENARLHEESKQSALLRERILAVVSHDLRDPLGTIDLANTLLLRNHAVREDPHARRQIEVIHRGTQRAVRLVGDLLDVASIQAGKLSLQVAARELRPLLDETVEAYEPLAREKGVRLRWELGSEGTWVRCDGDRLRQVLANLMGNALRFTPAGGEIVVRADVEGGEARLSVADTGPGIVPEEREHIFDLYWKSRRPEGGTGLGLFIARGIVESHGGQMWVESQPGQGSRFTFTLQVAPPPLQT